MLGHTNKQRAINTSYIYIHNIPSSILVSLVFSVFILFNIYPVVYIFHYISMQSRTPEPGSRIVYIYEVTHKGWGFNEDLKIVKYSAPVPAMIHSLLDILNGLAKMNLVTQLQENHEPSSQLQETMNLRKKTE